MESSEAMEVDKKRPARFSKNKKRNWKKVDISTEESFLEKKRFDEIQFGGDITEQKDGDLFFIDKKGTIGQNKKVRKGNKTKIIFLSINRIFSQIFT